MHKKTLISEILLVLTTIIWGSAFVFQDIAMKYVSPITFNVERTILGAIFLLIVYYIYKVINKKKNKENTIEKSYKKKDLIFGSLACGFFLSIAMIFQQIGITFEGAGKSGFITALYIIFVPVIELFFKRKPNILIILGILLATGGLILINYSDGVVSFNEGSLYLLGCAIAFSFQILSIDYFSNKCNALLLTSGQLFVAFLIQLPLMFIFEKPDINAMLACYGPALFCGIMSSGIAYCLQTFTQKNVQPTIASLLMSLESVFSVIFAMIILRETYGVLEIVGCVLLFIAIIVAQIPLKVKKNSQNKE